MHPLSDILTTRELQRWRLILGPAADNSLGGLDERARQVDRALEWLYGRDPQRLQRAGRVRPDDAGVDQRHSYAVSAAGYRAAGERCGAALRH